MKMYQCPVVGFMVLDRCEVQLQGTAQSLLVECGVGTCQDETLGFTCDPTGIFVTVLVPGALGACETGSDFPCSVKYNNFTATGCAAYDCPSESCGGNILWKIACDYPVENNVCLADPEPTLEITCSGNEAAGCDFLFVGT